MRYNRKLVSHLPPGLVSRARDLYRAFTRKRSQARRERLPELDAAQFRAILTGQLGVSRGDLVFIHSSVDGLAVSAPLSEVLSILREVVG